MRRFVILILLLQILLMLYPNFAYAQTKNILINEVFFNPKGSDKGKEWVELYNGSNLQLNLGGYSIEVAGSKWKSVLTIETDTFIDPMSYFLICEQEIDGCDLKTDKIGMQNGGSATDGVRLVDDKGKIIDTILYDSPNSNELKNDFGAVELNENCVKGIKEDHSLARIGFQDSNLSVKDFIVTEEITPDKKNISKSCFLEDISELEGCFIDLFVSTCWDSGNVCVIHDEKKGSKVLTDTNITAKDLTRQFVKGFVKKQDGQLYLESIDSTYSIEPWEFRYTNLSSDENQLYQFITADLELVYEEDDFYYFSSGSKLYRLVKSDLDTEINLKLGIKQIFRIRGVLIPYSVDQQENEKLEIFPIEVDLNQEEDLNQLVKTGKSISRTYLVVLLFGVIALLGLVIKSFFDTIENLVNLYLII